MPCTVCFINTVMLITLSYLEAQEGGGGGTPLNKQYRYVRRPKVQVLTKITARLILPRKLNTTSTW